MWARTADILTGADLDHVRTNVENECRLPELAWEDLFAALDSAAAANLPAAMTQVFQDRTLHGPKIPDTPAPKGRAIKRRDFSGLMEQTWSKHKHLLRRTRGSNSSMIGERDVLQPIPTISSFVTVSLAGT